MSNSAYVLVARCIIFLLVINFGCWSGSSTILASLSSVAEKQKPGITSRVWNYFKQEPKISPEEAASKGVSKNSTVTMAADPKVAGPTALPKEAAGSVGKRLNSKVSGTAVNPGHNPLNLEISVDEAASKRVSKNSTVTMAADPKVAGPTALPKEAAGSVGKRLNSKVSGTAVKPGHNPLNLEISVDEAASKGVSKNSTVTMAADPKVAGPTALPKEAAGSVGKRLNSKVSGTAVNPGHNPLNLEISVDEAASKGVSKNSTVTMAADPKVAGPTALPKEAAGSVGKRLNSKVSGTAVNPGHNPLNLEISVDEAASKGVSKNSTVTMAADPKVAGPTALPKEAAGSVGKRLNSKVFGTAVNPGHNPLNLEISVDEAASKGVSKNSTVTMAADPKVAGPTALPKEAAGSVGKRLNSKVFGTAVNPGHNPLNLEISVDEAASKGVSKNSTVTMAADPKVVGPTALPKEAAGSVGKRLNSKLPGRAINPGHNPLKLEVSIDEAAGKVVSQNNTARMVVDSKITGPAALPKLESIEGKKLNSKVFGTAVNPGHNPLNLEISVDEAASKGVSKDNIKPTGGEHTQPSIEKVPSGQKLGTKASDSTPIDTGKIEEPVAFETPKPKEDQRVNSTAAVTAPLVAAPVITVPVVTNDTKQDIIKHEAAAPIIMFNSLDLMSSTLSSRLSSVNNQYGKALSSGDESTVRKGFWAGTTWSSTRQKQNNNIAAFKNRQQGVVLGVDAELDDNLTIGAAYILGLSKTKFDSTANNKQRARLHIVALYTEYNFLSGITLNSYLEYGKAFIKSNDTTNNVSLSGKTKGDIMRAKLEGYYQYNVGTLVLKPIVGIKYDYYTIKSYTAHSQDFYVNVPSSKGKRISVEAGIVLGKDITLKECTISPEVHFGLEKAILVSNSSRVISVNDAATQTQIWSTRPSGSSGLQDIIYTVGGRVRVRSSSRIEIGAGYDYSFKKKFSNHSVYLSSKITF